MWDEAKDVHCRHTSLNLSVGDHQQAHRHKHGCLGCPFCVCIWPDTPWESWTPMCLRSVQCHMLWGVLDTCATYTEIPDDNSHASNCTRAPLMVICVSDNWNQGPTCRIWRRNTMSQSRYICPIYICATLKPIFLCYPIEYQPPSSYSVPLPEILRWCTWPTPNYSRYTPTILFKTRVCSVQRVTGVSLTCMTMWDEAKDAHHQS